jgi:hypothetical protein
MKKYIIAAVILLLLLAGCNKDPSNQLVDQNKLIYSGTDGLVIEFAKNAPPERIQAGQSFPVIVKLSNEGAEDVNVNSAYYLISGETPTFYESSFGTQPQTIPATVQGATTLQGKKSLPTEGAKSILPTVTVTAKPFSTSIYDQESIKANIRATVCYLYKTTLQSNACIDPQAVGYEPIEPSCKMDIINYQDQGAPIAITSVTPNIVADSSGNKRVQFRIVFDNGGKGLVLNSDRIADGCRNPSLTEEQARTMYGEVRINGWLAGTQIDCDPTDNAYSASQGKRVMSEQNPDVNFFLCESDTSFLTNRNTAFTTDVKFELTYGYTETITHPVTIEGTVQ